jgi:teichuronic acid biosynthesis glycosyltransferase TuaC
MRTLLFSTLYPSSVRPLHGIFVETRLRELLSQKGVQTQVVAPVPWFWSTDAKHGDYAALARTPRHEVHNGIEVHHPRFARLPKVGMSTAPLSLALGARATLGAIRRGGFDFDVIDAHYFYPDGVAAALLALWFNKPLVVTARGTDVNLIPQYRVPRLLIRWALGRANASIGVSGALVERLRALGGEDSRLHVMRNGVDLNRFHAMPAAAVRAQLGITGSPVILTVGNLHEHKGQRLTVQAFALLRQHFPGASLWVVGDGPDKSAIAQDAQRLGLADAVHLVGPVPNTELVRWYSAADLSVLASSREGWPNVLLESMACGTPVVASAVGGVAEIVREPAVGTVVPERTAQAFAAAMQGLLERAVARERVRAYAEGFGWDKTSQDQLTLFERLAKPA